MRERLKTQKTFNSILKILAFFSKRKFFDKLTFWMTKSNAKLNIRLNKPKYTDDVRELAETWKKMMPADGQEFFKIAKISEDIAYTEIHLHCPLRGTGHIEACNKLMNYDRTLMREVGGELIVLESQSNSGKNYCSLAIRKKGSDQTPQSFST